MIKVAGLDPIPGGQCPRCGCTRILGPRVVKDGERWCNCYRCGHAWQVNKPKVRKGGRPSWSPKVKATAGDHGLE